MFRDMDTAALDTVDMGLMETNDRWQLVFIHILRLVLKFFFFNNHDSCGKFHTGLVLPPPPSLLKSEHSTLFFKMSQTN